MNFISILQLIAALAPGAVTITQDVIAIIQEITNAINGTPGSAEHSAAVAKLAEFTTQKNATPAT